MTDKDAVAPTLVEQSSAPGKKDVCHLNGTVALGDATLGDIGQTGRDKHGVIHAESKE